MLLTYWKRKRFHGSDVFVRPNFNSADPPPGSTSTHFLAAILGKLQALGAGPLTIGGRSGMGETRKVMNQRGVFALAKEAGAKVVVFDELKYEDWEFFRSPDSRWQRGFAMPRLVGQAEGIVQACCLKTHRFGGHFTLSLKNSVGLAAKTLPGESYNFMSELHSSSRQRRMIAELNDAYRPELILMDGVQAFTHGGPAQGVAVSSQVILAGTD